MRQRGVATVWQVSGASIAAFVGLWLTPMTGSLARAETPEVSPAGAIGLGNHPLEVVAVHPIERQRHQRRPDGTDRFLGKGDMVRNATHNAKDFRSRFTMAMSAEHTTPLPSAPAAQCSIVPPGKRPPPRISVTPFSSSYLSPCQKLMQPSGCLTHLQSSAWRRTGSRFDTNSELSWVTPVMLTSSSVWISSLRMKPKAARPCPHRNIFFVPLMEHHSGLAPRLARCKFVKGRGGLHSANNQF